MGADLPRYPNRLRPVSLIKCPHDHQPIDNECLSDSKATNISKSFTYKMATKTTRIDIEITLLSHPDSLQQIGRQTIVTITVPVPFISLKLTFIARAYMYVDLYYVHPVLFCKRIFSGTVIRWQSM